MARKRSARQRQTHHTTRGKIMNQIVRWIKVEDDPDTVKEPAGTNPKKVMFSTVRSPDPSLPAQDSADGYFFISDPLDANLAKLLDSYVNNTLINFEFVDDDYIDYVRYELYEHNALVFLPFVIFGSDLEETEHKLLKGAIEYSKK